MTRHKLLLILSFFFSVQLTGNVQAIEMPNTSLGPPEKSSTEPPFDWSKPVVSRGFGEVVATSENEKSDVAQYKSGQVLYFFGSYKKAIEKWEPLLERNFAVAQASMGWLYQMGWGVPQDTKKAFALYAAAAAQQNAVAENNLGVMYEQGIEVDVDFSMARKWYEKSAENGYRFGQYNYANLLLEGLGGEKQSKLAIEWYTKSAAQNVKQAIEKLISLNKE